MSKYKKARESMAFREYVEMLFWDRVDKRDENECWGWVGSFDQKGYGTRADNNQDKINKNRQTKGEDCHTSKVTKYQVLEMQRLSKGGWSNIELAKHYGLNPKHVQKILHGKSWKSVPREYIKDSEVRKGERHRLAVFTEKDVVWIRNTYAEGRLTQTEIGKLFEVSQSTIGYIVRGDTWKDVPGPILKERRCAAPRVLNKHKDEIPADAIYIGRPGKWGNPFRIGKDGTREEVILKYQQWLLSQPQKVEEVKQELVGKDLVCFCSPKPCHGDVLIQVANTSRKSGGSL